MPLSGYIAVIKHDGGEGPICEWCSTRCDIGRDPSCDISISLPTVAPIHCSLELMENGLVKATSHSDDQFVLLIDGDKLKGSRILPNGCLITVGDRHLRFFYPSHQKSVHFTQSPMNSPNTPNASGDSPKKSPMKTTPRVASPRTINTPGSMPKVHPSKKVTPKPRPISPARFTPRSRSTTPKATLGTRERYGPVPPRPTVTPPVIQVLRHTPNVVSQTPPPQQAINTPKLVHSPTSTSEPLHEAKEVNLLTTQETPKMKSLSTQSPHFTNSASKQHSNTLPVLRSPSRIKTPYKSPEPVSRRSPSSVFRGETPKATGKTHDATHPTGTSTTPNRARLSQNLTVQASPSGHIAKTRSPVSSKRLVANIERTKINDSSSFQSNASTLREESTTPKGSPQQSSQNQTTRKSPNTTLNNVLPAAVTPKVNRSRSSSASLLKLTAQERMGAVRSGAAYPQSEYVKRTGIKRDVGSRASMLTEDILRAAASKRSKGVSFGPALSPEQFDRTMPPSTPVKKGAIPSKFSTPKTSKLISQVATPTTTPIEESRLSNISSKLTSPSYAATTPGRISGVISVPPTPDENLFDSQSERIDRRKSRKMQVKVRYSAPVAQLTHLQQSKQQLNVRHSLVIHRNINKSARISQLKVPPSTPVSVEKSRRLSRHDTSAVKKSNSQNIPHEVTLITHTAQAETHQPDAAKISNIKSPKASNMNEKYPVVPDVTDHYRSTSSSPGSLHQSSVLRSLTKTPVSASRGTLKTPRSVSVRRLIKSPESIKSRASDVDNATLEMVSHRRSRSASASRTSTLTGRPSVGQSLARTPGSVRLVAANTPRLTGVRRLMRTPKSVKSPRMSGIASLFAVESSPNATVSVGRSQSSSTPVSGTSIANSRNVDSSLVNTPSNASHDAVKTPMSMKSPNISGVSNVFVGDMSHDVRTTIDHRGSKSASISRAFKSSGRPSTGRSSVKTPRSVRRTAANTPRLTKTPRSMKSHVPGVANKFVTDLSTDVVSNLDRRSSGAASISRTSTSTARTSVGRSFSKTPRSVHHVAAKTPRSTGIRRLMKTPKSVESPRVSGGGNIFVNDKSSDAGANVDFRRSRSVSASRNSTPIRLSNDRSLVKTPGRVRHIAARTPRLTGIRRLMKTPKSVKSPRVSGLANIFVGDESPASVDRRRSKSASASRNSTSSRRHSVGRSLTRTPVSVRRAAAKTPHLTGVRRLMKTPKSVKSPRVSGLANIFVGDKSASVDRRRSRPASALRISTSSGRSSAGRSSVKTPRSIRRVVTKTPHLTGVRRLMKTPKSLKSPRVSGLATIFIGDKSPDAGTSIDRRHSRSASALRKSTSSARPSAGRSSTKTPISVSRVAARTPSLTGTRRLMKTPKSVKSPRVSGLANIFVGDESPAIVDHPRSRSASASRNSTLSRHSVGRSLTRTPVSVRRAAAKTPHLTGVRRLMKTPKSLKSPRVSGLANIFAGDESPASVDRRRSKSASASRNSTSSRRHSVGRSLTRTPRSALHVAVTSPHSTAVRRLIKTPKSVKSRVSAANVSPDLTASVDRSRRDTDSVSLTSTSAIHPSFGRSLSKTPSSVARVAAKTPHLTSVRRLMKTPKSLKSPRVSGLANIFVGDDAGANVSSRRSRSAPASRTSSSSAGPSAVRSLVKSPGSSRRVAVKTPRLTSARRLKTPKSLKSPHVSGLTNIFVGDAAPNVDHRSLGKASVSPYSSLTIRPSVGRSLSKTPVSVHVAAKSPHLTSVRRSLKTPESVKSPRVSGDDDSTDVAVNVDRRHSRSVSVAHNSTPSNRTSVGRSLVNIPDSVRHAEVRTPRQAGVRRLLKTPKSVKSPRLTGVRRLLTTPKSMKSPRVSGIVSLFTDESARAIPHVVNYKSMGRRGRLVKALKSDISTPAVSVSVSAGENSILKLSRGRSRRGISKEQSEKTDVPSSHSADVARTTRKTASKRVLAKTVASSSDMHTGELTSSPSKHNIRSRPKSDHKVKGTNKSITSPLISSKSVRGRSGKEKVIDTSATTHRKSPSPISVDRSLTSSVRAKSKKTNVSSKATAQFAIQSTDKAVSPQSSKEVISVLKSPKAARVTRSTRTVTVSNTKTTSDAPKSPVKNMRAIVEKTSPVVLNRRLRAKNVRKLSPVHTVIQTKRSRTISQTIDSTPSSQIQTDIKKPKIPVSLEQTSSKGNIPPIMQSPKATRSTRSAKALPVSRENETVGLSKSPERMTTTVSSSETASKGSTQKVNIKNTRKRKHPSPVANKSLQTSSVTDTMPSSPVTAVTRKTKPLTTAMPTTTRSRANVKSPAHKLRLPNTKSSAKFPSKSPTSAPSPRKTRAMRKRV